MSALINDKIWSFDRFAEWLLWLLAVKESDSNNVNVEHKLDVLKSITFLFFWSTADIQLN